MLITDAYREQNRQLHAGRADYGTSGKAWAPQVRPLADWGRKAVLDFGCGKATLAARLGPAYRVTNYDSCIDLVITVNTTAVHLAGALGIIPAWCLTPVMCAWRYQCQGPMPWYGSVEMFRQQKAGEWGPVLGSVERGLRGHAAIPKGLSNG